MLPLHLSLCLGPTPSRAFGAQQGQVEGMMGGQTTTGDRCGCVYVPLWLLHGSPGLGPGISQGRFCSGKAGGRICAAEASTGKAGGRMEALTLCVCVCVGGGGWPFSAHSCVPRATGSPRKGADDQVWPWASESLLPVALDLVGRRVSRFWVKLAEYRVVVRCGPSGELP